VYGRRGECGAKVRTSKKKEKKKKTKRKTAPGPEWKIVEMIGLGWGRGDFLARGEPAQRAFRDRGRVCKEKKKKRRKKKKEKKKADLCF
jgi:hypothetical protein